MEKIQTVSYSRAPIYILLWHRRQLFERWGLQLPAGVIFLVLTVAAGGEINLSEAGPQEPSLMIL